MANWVVRYETTQFPTSHNALSSDKTRSVEIRSDEVMWYEKSWL